MKQLFKTTLLAATIAATCGTAVAGDVSVVKQVHSSEGLAGVTETQTSNKIYYKLGAAYREGDKITFTFPDGALVSTTFPSVLEMNPVNDADKDKAIAGLTWGLLNSDSKQVTYRVTTLTLPNDNATPPVEHEVGSTVGGTLELSAVGYKPTALENPVTVTVSSQTTAGDVLDNNGTRTATVAEKKSQFGGAKITHKFDETIDVSSMRKAFVGTSSDSLSWVIENPTTTGWMNMATVNTSNGTLFTLVGEAGKMTDVADTTWSAGGAKKFTVADATLVVTYGGMKTNDTITFTPATGDKAVVLETQTFSSKLEYNYSSAGNQAGSVLIGGGLASGEWKLNGATVNVPYMPYGPSASQILYVANAGKQAGDISATVFDEKGNFFDLGVIGVAKGETVNKIAPLVKAAMEAKGFSSTKASITITVNAPAADITVYASYNIGSADRGFINTDQYKGK